MTLRESPEGNTSRLSRKEELLQQLSLRTASSRDRVRNSATSPELARLMEDAEKNIAKLRGELEGSADIVLDRFPEMGDTTSLIPGKQIYIRTAGTSVIPSPCVNSNGGLHHLYIPSLVETIRDRQLNDAASLIDEETIQQIFALFPRGSRILNVGCDSDERPLDATAEFGHEIICNDGNQEMVDLLAERRSSPINGLAFDVEHTDRILPENAVDIVYANSVIGYLHPHKIREALIQMSRVAKEGIVLRFDLFPLVSLKRVLEADIGLGTAEMGNHYMDVLKYCIEEFGKEDAARALAYYEGVINVLSQIAMFAVIEEILEEEGMTVKTSVVPISHSEGTKFSWSVKASFDPKARFLKPVGDEELIDPHSLDITKYLELGQIALEYALIDRVMAQEIAGLLELGSSSPRQACWDLIDHIAEKKLEYPMFSQINRERILQNMLLASAIEAYRKVIFEKRDLPKTPELSPGRQNECREHRLAADLFGLLPESSLDMMMSIIKNQTDEAIVAKYRELGEEPLGGFETGEDINELVEKPENLSDILDAMEGFLALRSIHGAAPEQLDSLLESMSMLKAHLAQSAHQKFASEENTDELSRLVSESVTRRSAAEVAYARLMRNFSMFDQIEQAGTEEFKLVDHRIVPPSLPGRVRKPGGKAAKAARKAEKEARLRELLAKKKAQKAGGETEKDTPRRKKKRRK
jgi:hypothetical protein